MTINHPEAILDALRNRGIYCASQPFHLDTVWVHLADGSTLHIGDYEDNLELLGGNGYSIYRCTEDGTGVGGSADDGDLLASPDTTFDELLDAIAEQVEQHGAANIFIDPTVGAGAIRLD